MKKSTAALFATLIFSSTSYANPPQTPDLVQGGNRWSITFYDDSSPTHTQWATQTLCFYAAGNVGTHQRYEWVSDSFPDWNGRATQEGDQIFMHGDYQWPHGQARDRGHDGMEWQIVTGDQIVADKVSTLGTGHWKEWIEDERFGRTVGFGNARLQRIGNCEIKDAEEALYHYLDLELPLDPDGNVLDNPAGIPMAGGSTGATGTTSARMFSSDSDVLSSQPVEFMPTAGTSRMD